MNDGRHEWGRCEQDGSQPCTRCGMVRRLEMHGFRGYRLMFWRAGQPTTPDTGTFDEPPCEPEEAQ